MEKTRSGNEPHPVSLRSVLPAVPHDEAEKMMLVEDLIRIGCKGLLTHPWSLRNEEMVREFSQECSNEWESTLKRDPERWTTVLWAEVYQLSNHPTSKINVNSFWMKICLKVFKLQGLEGGIGVPKHGGSLHSIGAGLLIHQTSKNSIMLSWMKISS